MAETHHDRTSVPPRDEQGGATGDARQEGEGDAQIRQSPPNVEQTQRPADDLLGDDDEEEADEMRWGRGGGSSDAAQDEPASASAEEIERLQGEVATATDRYMRLAAEFDNYRRRGERERAEMPQRARADIARPLLDVMDDLERVAAQGENTPAVALLEGIQLVGRKFSRLLEGLGIEPIDPVGAPFDPTTMEAVATVETNSEDEDGTVSDVFQKGYRLGDMLVRPARVRVRQFAS